VDVRCNVAIHVILRLRDIDTLLKRIAGNRALTPRESDILIRGADIVLRRIQDEWPVDTGTSVDSFTVEPVVTPGQIGIEVYNPMYYAEYVHKKGENPNVPLYTILFPEIWADIKPILIARLTVEIARTQDRIRAAGGGRQATLRELRG
jgi:hypothetical protein